MIEQLTTLTESNDFLQGGVILMALGAALAYLKNIPVQLWGWTKRRLFVDVEILMKDDAFIWLSDWLANQPYTKNWSRHLSVRTTKQGCRDNEPPRVLLSPAPGTHFLLWKGYFLIVKRIRQDDKNSESVYTFVPREHFEISLLSPRRRVDVIRKLISEARDVSSPPDDNRIDIRAPDYGNWAGGTKCRPRPLESVILRDGVMESLIKDVKWFLVSESWFIQRGIPYRRGYLLHGQPGNGKSSIVVALASHFNLDVCVVNLGSPRLDDEHLRSLLTNVPKHSIILIEDIDCVFEDRVKTEDNKSELTFSGLLNAIDGVSASEGRLLFMSTNHIEKLDEALIRPGRCDVQMKIENADKDQARRLFLQFFPGEHIRAGEFASQVKDASMASLQGHLLKWADDPDTARSFKL